MSYLEISRNVLPQLKMGKERWGKGGGVAGYRGCLVMTSLPVTKAFYLKYPYPVVRLAPDIPLK